LGFRLPTAKELESLVDLIVLYPGPTIDQTAFPGTPAAQYMAFWTASPCADPSGQSFVVDFMFGYSPSAGVGSSYWVRCVR
jgi:hypothetical protein